MTFDLCVIGLGYVGLPLATEATAVGMAVAGLDLDADVVERLSTGQSHVDDVGDSAVKQMVASGFLPTTDPAVIAASRVVVVCVPTPLLADRGPDLGAVRNAAATVGAHARPGTLVVLESSTYPGTTDEVVRPLVEVNGLRVGETVHLAYSPERIDPGNPRFGLRNTPKIVGGCTETCTEAARAFYARLVDEVVVARGTREAEMAKLLENTYRHVNIALVNEMAVLADLLRIDLWDVIRCASTKPFGFQAFRPGPGVGGHCIPIDPNYLSYKVRADLDREFRFVALAQEINQSMPGYVVHRVQDALNRRGRAVNGSRVGLLGVTYKADIADLRESPARDVARGLLGLGAHLCFHDPHVAGWTVGEASLRGAASAEDLLRDCDIAVLLQAHSAFDLEALEESGCPVLDTRGVLRAGPTVERL